MPDAARKCAHRQTVTGTPGKIGKYGWRLIGYYIDLQVHLSMNPRRNVMNVAPDHCQKMPRAGWTNRAGELLARMRVRAFASTAISVHWVVQSPLASVQALACGGRAINAFRLHSRLVLPTEISQRFCFSSLPPSFAAGRCATPLSTAAGASCARRLGA